MRSLQSFLESAPKSLTKELHTRFLGKRGLLSNSQILADLTLFLCDTTRVQSWLSGLEPWQVRTIRFIYQSGSRGLEAHELLASVPQANRNQCSAFLLGAAEQLLIWRCRNSHSFVYYGFADFWPFFPPVVEPLADAASLRWKDNVGMPEWHLAQVLAHAQSGRLRINASGDLHRRSAQLCEDQFRYGAQVAAAASSDELLLLLQFFLDKDWLGLRDGLLQPSRIALDFLRRNGFRLRHEVLLWWISRRCAGDSALLRHLLTALTDGVTARGAGELFWPLDPASRPFGDDSAMSWESLPRPLRELWLLGLLECGSEDGRITRFRTSALGHEWMGGAVSPLTGAHHACLPNYEMILSVSNGPWRMFQAACLAKSANDEPVLRFSLTRDVFLEGLRNGPGEGFAEEFLQWCGAPANVMDSLREWLLVHTGARIATCRVLKVTDAAKRDELARFPQFLDHTEETIAGWGFVLKDGHETQVREILRHFGLEPPPDEPDNAPKPLRQAEWSKQFHLPWPAQGETDYDFKPGPDREAVASAMGATKYSTEFQQLEQSKLLQVLRYAHVTETPLEAKIKNTLDRKSEERLLSFTIQRLQVRREPFHLEAMLSPGREVVEIPFAHIQQIRLQTV